MDVEFKARLERRRKRRQAADKRTAAQNELYDTVLTVMDGLGLIQEKLGNTDPNFWLLEKEILRLCDIVPGAYADAWMKRKYPY